MLNDVLRAGFHSRFGLTAGPCPATDGAAVAAGCPTRERQFDCVCRSLLPLGGPTK